MKSRLSTVVGFLTAASLLSGSAFAFAPEFIDDLPTVIITDRVSGPPEPPAFDAPNGGWGDPPDGLFRPSSAFLFRYDDAFDLAPLVDLRDAASLADVKVLFTEYDDTSDLTPNSTGVLSINDKTALPNYPDDADFATTAAFDLADSYLSFRNIDFSPGTGDGPFDPVGDLTSFDLRITDGYSRIVTLHLGSDNFTDRGTSSDRSFLVITQIDDIGDRLTDAAVTDPFDQLLYENGANFDGWVVSPIFGATTAIATNGAQPATPTNPPITGFGVTPSVTLANATTPAVPAGATSLSARTNQGGNNTQVGLLGFQAPVGSGIDLESNSLYRARINMQTSSTASNAALYVQFGSVFASGIATAGYQDLGPYGNTGTALEFPQLSTSAEDFDLYLLTRGAAPAPDGTIINVFIVDSNTADGQDFTLNSVTIERASGGRAALGGGTTVRNLGAASFTTDSGEDTKAPLPSSPTAFTRQSVSSIPGTSIIDDAPVLAGVNAAVPNSLNITDNLLTAQHGWASNPPASGDYFEVTNFVWTTEAPSGFNVLDLDKVDTGIETDPNKLYILDVWASIDQANRIAPNLVSFVTNDLSNFAATNWNTGATGISNPPSSLIPDPETQLSTTARVFSLPFSPNTPNPSAKTSFQLLFLWINGQSVGFGQLQQATIRVHRVVLTEYEPY